MPFEIMGTGTAHYGESKWEGDSHVTTRWISFLGLPIYPLESYRIVEDQGSFESGPFISSHKLKFQIIERLPLQRRQIFFSYLLVYTYILFLVAMFIGVARHMPYFNSFTGTLAIFGPMAGKEFWDRRQRTKARERSHRAG